MPTTATTTKASVVVNLPQVTDEEGWSCNYSPVDLVSSFMPKNESCINRNSNTVMGSLSGSSRAPLGSPGRATMLPARERKEMQSIESFMFTDQFCVCDQGLGCFLPFFKGCRAALSTASFDNLLDFTRLFIAILRTRMNSLGLC